MPPQFVSVLKPLKRTLGALPPAPSASAKSVSNASVAQVIFKSPFPPPCARIRSPESSSTKSNTAFIPAPSVIVFLILRELSNRNNIFAGTSPSPEPGGIGFEKTLSVKIIINNKILTIIIFINLLYVALL